MKYRVAVGHLISQGVGAGLLLLTGCSVDFFYLWPHFALPPSSSSSCSSSFLCFFSSSSSSSFSCPLPPRTFPVLPLPSRLSVLPLPPPSFPLSLTGAPISHSSLASIFPSSSALSSSSFTYLSFSSSLFSSFFSFSSSSFFTTIIIFAYLLFFRSLPAAEAVFCGRRQKWCIFSCKYY